MARGSWSGRRGWTLLAVVVVGCVAALLTIALLPPPASSGCTTCQGRQLSTILVLGPGHDVGTSVSHLYCFPVESVNSTITLKNIDIGIYTPSGAWVTPDENWTVQALDANGGPVGSYHFYDYNGTEGPLWDAGADASVTQGYTFCLSSQSTDLGGLTFALVGVGFTPTGQVTARIP